MPTVIEKLNNKLKFQQKSVLFSQGTKKGAANKDRKD